jgi:non-specific serine/threonine protein kinase
VLELVGSEVEGDAGPLLDERAKQQYRARVGELRSELDEASAHNDLGRAERLRAELDALSRELARAVGLGGRDRRAASHAERARINVQRRLRDVIRRVEEQDPVLGEHLDRSLRTGVFCRYEPVWP